MTLAHCALILHRSDIDRARQALRNFLDYAADPLISDKEREIAWRDAQRCAALLNKSITRPQVRQACLAGFGDEQERIQ